MRFKLPSRRALPPLGAVREVVDEDGVAERIGELGDAGTHGRALAAAAEARMAALADLSPLTSRLAVDYVDRIGKALKGLAGEVGVYVATWAYAAHLAVEADPGAYGATDVPVLGNLPEPHRGRPPQDLTNRIVRASRRDFGVVCAPGLDAWAGFVACVTARVHLLGSEGDDDEGPAYLDPAVVDGLARFGWLLRQVDLHYGLEPVPAGG